MKALVVHPDGTADLTAVPAGDGDRVTWFNETVGSLIQPIYGPDWVCYVDENNELTRGPLNMPATLLAHRLGWPSGNAFVGRAVFFGKGQDDTDTDVPDRVLRGAHGWQIAVRTED